MLKKVLDLTESSDLLEMTVSIPPPNKICHGMLLGSQDALDLAKVVLECSKSSILKTTAVFARDCLHPNNTVGLPLSDRRLVGKLARNKLGCVHCCVPSFSGGFTYPLPVHRCGKLLLSYNHVLGHATECVCCTALQALKQAKASLALGTSSTASALLQLEQWDRAGCMLPCLTHMHEDEFWLERMCHKSIYFPALVSCLCMLHSSYQSRLLYFALYDLSTMFVNGRWAETDGDAGQLAKVRITVLNRVTRLCESIVKQGEVPFGRGRGHGQIPIFSVFGGRGPHVGTARQ